MCRAEFYLPLRHHLSSPDHIQQIDPYFTTDSAFSDPKSTESLFLGVDAIRIHAILGTSWAKQHNLTIGIAEIAAQIQA